MRPAAERGRKVSFLYVRIAIKLHVCNQIVGGDQKLNVDHAIKKDM